MNVIKKNIQWYFVQFCEIQISRYCISFVSPLQSSRQFIHNRLNKPQRKPFIKVRERASERPRPSNVRQKFSAENQPDSRWAPCTGQVISISKSARLHASARGGNRKRSRGRRKAEKGRREREERGGTRMHFCLHLPVTSEETSCLGLLSPGGHYYCFRLACSFLRLPFSLQPYWALLFHIYPLHR